MRAAPEFAYYALFNGVFCTANADGSIPLNSKVIEGGNREIIAAQANAALELYDELCALNDAIVDAAAAGTIPPLTGPLLDAIFASRAAIAKVTA